MKHFFESSFLTWEITSDKNIAFIRNTFEHLEYFEDNERNSWEHKDTSDYLFQQRPIGGQRPFLLQDSHILKDELILMLTNHGLAAEDKIEFVPDPAIPKYRQQMQNAACFCNTSYAIFLISENNIVTTIWFDYEDRICLDSDRLAMGNLLHQLGKRYSLILIDWYDKLVIDLSDIKTTFQYLDDTAEDNKAFFQKIKDNK